MGRGIAIFASGGGSNAEQIIKHFESQTDIEVRLILTNNSKAYVIERAKSHNIPSVVVSKGQFQDPNFLLSTLAKHDIDFIALAGFLKLIPSFLIEAFPQHIVNIHPALLPKYGGHGMYGAHVHQAVFDNNERTSGMTIHFVDQNYDEGKIIFQAQTELDATDTPDLIAKKVLTLEHLHYGRVLESVIKNS